MLSAGVARAEKPERVEADGLASSTAGDDVARVDSLQPLGAVDRLVERTGFVTRGPEIDGTEAKASAVRKEARPVPGAIEVGTVPEADELRRAVGELLAPYHGPELPSADVHTGLDEGLLQRGGVLLIGGGQVGIGAT